MHMSLYSFPLLFCIPQSWKAWIFALEMLKHRYLLRDPRYLIISWQKCEKANATRIFFKSTYFYSLFKCWDSTLCRWNPRRLTYVLQCINRSNTQNVSYFLFRLAIDVENRSNSSSTSIRYLRAGAVKESDLVRP